MAALTIVRSSRRIGYSVDGMNCVMKTTDTSSTGSIQNAVDAGSTEIDIRFEYVDGRLVVHVDDYGEGMDRHIIDTKLTRLFSSSKEGDRTKIGRFGIGFVSVFALQPEVICLDTSRAGEHWLAGPE